MKMCDHFQIVETDNRTFTVLSGISGENAVVYESWDRDECVKYIEGQRPCGIWRMYLVADLKTWATNAEGRSPLEYYDTFEEAKQRFCELRPLPCNLQKDRFPDRDDYYAHLGLGIDRVDGFSAIDILHVKKGENYLIDDFTRIDGINTDANALNLIRRTASEIGFDRVRRYSMQADGTFQKTDIPYSDWQNPYFKLEAEKK